MTVEVTVTVGAQEVVVFVNRNGDSLDFEVLITRDLPVLKDEGGEYSYDYPPMIGQDDLALDCEHGGQQLTQTSAPDGDLGYHLTPGAAQTNAWFSFDVSGVGAGESYDCTITYLGDQGLFSVTV